MNATLALLLAVVSADPAHNDLDAIFEPSAQFATVIRGQSPTFTYEETQSFGSTQYGAPQYGAPQYGSPVMSDPFSQPCDTCGPAVQPYGIYAGFDFVFLKPSFSSDAAYLSERDRDNGGAADQVTIRNFDWDLDFSPRFWVGYVDPSGLGLQARYFMYEDGQKQAATDDGTESGSDYAVGFNSGTQLGGGGGVDIEYFTADGDTIRAVHNLEIQALDIEGTWRRPYTWGNVTVSGGVRLGEVNNDYSAQFSDAGANVLNTIKTRNEFKGVGPTVGILGRRRLGNSNLAIFASGRFSALFGDTTASIREIDPNSDDPDNNQLWSTKNNSVVPVTELQFGVDWTTPLWGPTRLFLRAALEGQVWFDAGTGMYSVDGDSNIPPQDGNLGLFGFIVGGGLTY